MQKADFEKKVQENMQELRFRPSDEVWKRVEAGIGEKRRRRPLVLWLLFAGLLLGGAYYFVNRPLNKGINVAGMKPVHPGQSIAGKQIKKDGVVESTTTLPEKQNVAVSETKMKLNESKVSVNQMNIASTDLKKRDQRNNVMSSGKKVEGMQEEITVNQPFISQEESAFLNPNAETELTRYATPFGIQGALKPETDVSGLAEESNALALNESALQSNKHPIKKVNWSFGITVSGGVSDLGEQLFQSAAASGLYYDPLTSNSGGGAVSHRPSEVKKGNSFSIGAYANKHLGPKWKLGIGVAYQYFSNSIRVGEKVDSAAIINQNSFAMDRVSQYYKSAGTGTGGAASGNKYDNKYHYVSVPLSVQWQFGKHFTWENQLTYSRLLSTNALHFDGATGSYYEKRDFFNNNQFFGSTAVLFGFKKNKVQVGPQLQYAFSNLLKSSIGNPKHLRSINLKANIDLWKK